MQPFLSDHLQRAAAQTDARKTRDDQEVFLFRLNGQAARQSRVGGTALLRLKALGHRQGQRGDATHFLEGVLFVDGRQHAVAIGVGGVGKQLAHRLQVRTAQMIALKGLQSTAAEFHDRRGRWSILLWFGLSQSPGEGDQRGRTIAVFLGHLEKSLDGALQVRSMHLGTSLLCQGHRVPPQPQVVCLGAAVFLDQGFHFLSG